jgi:hypothetical protein
MSQPNDGVPPHSWGAAYQPRPTRLALETLLFSDQTIGRAYQPRPTRLALETLLFSDQMIGRKTDPQLARTKLDAKRKYKSEAIRSNWRVRRASK